ncbi:uncharacterized protein HMPREF1541_04743 [Cyphellophora europaea CBS 101466]|uniref:Methyltransferase domain-containing protein n=1 Tax=Cyphellophora europaea (strain CBS 101466) TaxID=1220924 RepID=W2RVD6_CYPE1|nr:uncharacterized protein HMPREF1541_04743 [Cyphellophora europaea CBS 101466]ETN40466.1 hypothetical protein HMPREF1541_04743 [Cyphellophora europaea CBS 101466]
MSPTSIPTGTAFKSGNAFLERAYSLQSESEAKALYDEWASTYDADLAGEDYMSPTAAVTALAHHLDENVSSTPAPSSLTILDAGCGTGLVGLALKTSHRLRDAVAAVDGVDLSQGMLDVARKAGVYRELRTADLTKALDCEDGKYDAVLCVGTLTKGHVGPEVLGEFVRVVKKEGGLVVATVLSEIWVEGGFERVVEELRKEGRAEVLGAEEFGIRKGEEKGGRMLVLRKL